VPLLYIRSRYRLPIVLDFHVVRIYKRRQISHACSTDWSVRLEGRGVQRKEFTGRRRRRRRYKTYSVITGLCNVRTACRPTSTWNAEIRGILQRTVRARLPVDAQTPPVRFVVRIVFGDGLVQQIHSILNQRIRRRVDRFAHRFVTAVLKCDRKPSRTDLAAAINGRSHYTPRARGSDAPTLGVKTYTSSTKPEARNISQSRQRMTGPQPQR